MTKTSEPKWGIRFRGGSGRIASSESVVGLPSPSDDAVAFDGFAMVRAARTGIKLAKQQFEIGVKKGAGDMAESRLENALVHRLPP